MSLLLLLISQTSSPSRTERLVNAFIMSHLRSHPSASPWRPGVGSRHGHLQATVSLTFHRTNSTFLAVPRAKLANNFKMDLFSLKYFIFFLQAHRASETSRHAAAIRRNNIETPMHCLNGECPVDVVRLHKHINPYLLKEIENDGIYVFK